MRGLISVAAMLLIACEQRPPDADEGNITYVSITGDELRHNVDKMACWSKANEGKLDEVSEDGDCYELMPSQRWTGLWELGWEWSRFCPDPAMKCPNSNREDSWLDIIGTAAPTQDVTDGLYRVEFIGRRTLRPGAYGHLGQYAHQMYVERLISIQAIESAKK